MPSQQEKASSKLGVKNRENPQSKNKMYFNLHRLLFPKLNHDAQKNDESSCWESVRANTSSNGPASTRCWTQNLFEIRSSKDLPSSFSGSFCAGHSSIVDWGIQHGNTNDAIKTVEPDILDEENKGFSEIEKFLNCELDKLDASDIDDVEITPSLFEHQAYKPEKVPAFQEQIYGSHETNLSNFNKESQLNPEFGILDSSQIVERDSFLDKAETVKPSENVDSPARAPMNSAEPTFDLSSFEEVRNAWHY